MGLYCCDLTKPSSNWPHHHIHDPSPSTPLSNMLAIEYSMVVALTSLVIVFSLDRDWFRCNIILLDPRLEYSLQFALLALVVGISGSTIIHYHRFGKDTADSAEYQNKSLINGTAAGVAVGVGLVGYQYRSDGLAIGSEIWRGWFKALEGSSEEI